MAGASPHPPVQGCAARPLFGGLSSPRIQQFFGSPPALTVLIGCRKSSDSANPDASAGAAKQGTIGVSLRTLDIHRHANPSRARQRFDARRDVHPVANVNADFDFDAPLVGHIMIALGQRALDFDAALRGACNPPCP